MWFWIFIDLSGNYNIDYIEPHTSYSHFVQFFRCIEQKVSSEFLLESVAWLEKRSNLAVKCVASRGLQDFIHSQSDESRWAEWSCSDEMGWKITEWRIGYRKFDNFAGMIIWKEGNALKKKKDLSFSDSGMAFIFKHLAGVRFKQKKWKETQKKQNKKHCQILEYDSYAPLLDVFAASDKR